MNRKHNTGKRKNISSFLPSAKLRASLLAQRPLWGFFLLLFLLSSCSQSSSPKEDTVTFSGTVTIEDTTDFSGVTVSLYKPVELDTALTNLNTKYPGIGIEINQRTEFFWREYTPEYTTTTNSNGEWEISKVTPGEYHIVAQADSFGWKVKYNAASTNNNNISLKKAIIWNGTYSQSQTIPAGSFVQVKGNTMFTAGAQLTIEAGSIIEFQNNSALEVQSQFIVNGELGNEIFIVQQDTTNSSRIKLIESDNAQIYFTNVFYLKNGIYLKICEMVSFTKNRFREGALAFELLNCVDVSITNNILSDMDIGYISTSSTISSLKNIIINIHEYGIRSLNENHSEMKNCLIKKCGIYGMYINPRGGFYENRRMFDIQSCDFISNDTHLTLEDVGTISCTNSNFLNEENLIIRITGLQDYQSDTLNCKSNFWSYYNTNDIEQHILHRPDLIAIGSFGHLVDYSDFLFNYINWKNNI